MKDVGLESSPGSGDRRDLAPEEMARAVRARGVDVRAVEVTDRVR